MFRGSFLALSPTDCQVRGSSVSRLLHDGQRPDPAGELAGPATFAFTGSFRRAVKASQRCRAPIGCASVGRGSSRSCGGAMRPGSNWAGVSVLDLGMEPRHWDRPEEYSVGTSPRNAPIVEPDLLVRIRPCSMDARHGPLNSGRHESSSLGGMRGFINPGAIRGAVVPPGPARLRLSYKFPCDVMHVTFRISRRV